MVPRIGRAGNWRRSLKSARDTVQRILAQAEVRPHRLERYMASDDPDFETKSADVIGLYLAPPQRNVA
jgi:hypothetical protein